LTQRPPLRKPKNRLCSPAIAVCAFAPFAAFLCDLSG
jgi:hypothetical protein